MANERTQQTPDVVVWNAAESVWNNDDSYTTGIPTSGILQRAPSPSRLWRKIVHSGAGILALAFITSRCVPIADIPANIGTAPSGFPVKTIASGVETFSTGKPRDMPIPRAEMTDPTNGVSSGEENPPGMVRVEVGAGDNRWGWVPADKNGNPKREYVPAQ